MEAEDSNGDGQPWSPAQPLSVTCSGVWPPSQSRWVFSHVGKAILVFQFEPTASCPVTGQHWEGSGQMSSLPSLPPPVRYLCTLTRSWDISGLNSPCSLSLFSHEKCSKPLVIFGTLCPPRTRMFMNYAELHPLYVEIQILNVLKCFRRKFSLDSSPACSQSDFGNSKIHPNTQTSLSSIEVQ